MAAITAIVMVASTMSLAPAASAATGDIGYEDQSYSGTSEPTGTKRAESVLWWNDGSWWANMWDTSTNDFHIFRLDLASQTWVDTGTTVDPRANSHADVLWAAGHLYIASHLTVNDESPAVSGYPSNLYRFSYSAATKTYTLDAGFPVQINNYKTETLVIDRDSTGKLWATWQQDNKIYVNRTVGGDDHVWGTPFQLPVTATDVTVDDNSAVIAFQGDKIGVMWSNQSTSNDAMWFAVHDDGQPDTTWSAARTAIQGSNTADDHMNLKSIQADGSGRVYAAIKTSFTSGAQPLIMLLVRDTGTGDWASYPIARVSDCPNRPLVLIDEQNRVLHAFFSAPAAPNYACNSSGGAIHEKTSSLDSIAFPVGAGTPVILDYGTVKMHNASSTKQNVNSQTGIVVLARNNDTDHYWHHYEALPGGPPPQAPTADFGGSPTSGTAPLTVAFSDQSTGAPTSWSWTFGDGGTSTQQHPSHTYTTPGSYTVTLTATNAGGSDSLTRTDYISVSAATQAPTANFSGSPTSGTAPVAVQFTDTSTGGPTSWSWTFGDGGTSTQQHPSHTFTTAGTYNVTLTATNSGGSDAETRTDYISVSAAPDFSVSALPAKQVIVRGNSTTYNVTVTPLNGFRRYGRPGGHGRARWRDRILQPDIDDAAAGRNVSTHGLRRGSTTKVGSFTLTITATERTLSHSVVVVLQVKRK
jgi:PKD repeat protein